MFAEEADALQRFEERAADVERLFGLFRQQQTELGGQVTAEDKAELRRRLDALDDELNRALAREYGVDAGKDGAYDAWLEVTSAVSLVRGVLRDHEQRWVRCDDRESAVCRVLARSDQTIQ